ncbi:hypothetical protein NDU88_005330 [Pleurodeles waltl]|uniref:Reverse transcriptase n=1 Tax=Pleurodeles waltl TaxID=8319 RepID=A0AAV7MGK1_PLEWA|nr:hypothetical protein NDU88_005330 [Pleurodeles waltl]
MRPAGPVRPPSLTENCSHGGRSSSRTRAGKVTSEKLDGDITKAKVLAAIQRLPTGKAPGPDGFSAEYYKAVGPLLALVLTRLYNELGRLLPYLPRCN